VQYAMFISFCFPAFLTHLLWFPLCRTVEEWSFKYRAEQLYMMGRQIDELTECLNSAMEKFPLSCSSLEGMSLSCLER
jgi:hypothetical protein